MDLGRNGIGQEINGTVRGPDFAKSLTQILADSDCLLNENCLEWKWDDSRNSTGKTDLIPMYYLSLIPRDSGVVLVQPGQSKDDWFMRC